MTEIFYKDYPFIKSGPFLKDFQIGVKLTEW